MRTAVSLLSLPAVLLALNFPAHGCGRKAAPADKDPWVGSYSSASAFSWEAPGQPRRVSITRDGDGYRLSKPYDHWKFTEVRPGVLSDGTGGMGKICLGTLRFSDGVQVQVLRCEFCYEQFLLFRTPPERPEAQGAKAPPRK